MIARLNDAVVKAFEDPKVIKRLNELGHDIPRREQLTPAALGAFHKSEVEKWWPLIKAENIRIEQESSKTRRRALVLLRVMPWLT